MEQETDVFKRAIKIRNWQLAKMVCCAFDALNNCVAVSVSCGISVD